jgi:hypothetical protein
MLAAQGSRPSLSNRRRSYKKYASERTLRKPTTDYTDDTDKKMGISLSVASVKSVVQARQRQAAASREGQRPE